MKRHEIVFSLAKLPLDFIIIFISFFIAKFIRSINDFIPWVQLPLHMVKTEYLFYFALFWAVLYLIIFSIHWLYSLSITSSKIKEFLDIILYSIYWFIFYSFFLYFWTGIFYSIELPRLIIIFTCIIATILIIVERIILNKIQNKLLEIWKIEKRKIILINNKKYNDIKDIISDINSANIYEIIWYINKFDSEIKEFKYLWNIDNLENIFTKNNIDEILYIDSDYSNKDLYSLWDYSRIFGIRYRYITNSFDVTKTNTTITLLNKIPVIEIKNTPLDAWWRVLKRIIDIFSSFIGLILIFPFLIIVWIFIKIDDPAWPIIYKNRRVWQNWKIFNLYKFRYIKWEYCIKDSYWIDWDLDEALAFEKKLIQEKSTRNWPLYKIKDDPRKTRVWKFIEKYSIDELPQLVNVFLWNMSMVWPRPHQPREVKHYEIDQKRVLTIKPWITWLAQVNWRENNSFDNEVKLDIFYIENWNFLLDFKIFLKTFSIVLKRK